MLTRRLGPCCDGEVIKSFWADSTHTGQFYIMSFFDFQRGGTGVVPGWSGTLTGQFLLVRNPRAVAGFTQINPNAFEQQQKPWECNVNSDMPKQCLMIARRGVVRKQNHIWASFRCLDICNAKSAATKEQTYLWQIGFSIKHHHNCASWLFPRRKLIVWTHSQFVQSGTWARRA